jgi:hypothetical protein
MKQVTKMKTAFVSQPGTKKGTIVTMVTDRPNATAPFRCGKRATISATRFTPRSHDNTAMTSNRTM